MQNPVPSLQPGRTTTRSRSRSTAVSRIALDEYELAARWGLSVKTLRRWRQEASGPIFCKLGARVTYLISDVENYERNAARYSTSARAYR